MRKRLTAALLAAALATAGGTVFLSAHTPPAARQPAALGAGFPYHW